MPTRRAVLMVNLAETFGPAMGDCGRRSLQSCGRCCQALLAVSNRDKTIVLRMALLQVLNEYKQGIAGPNVELLQWAETMAVRGDRDKVCIYHQVKENYDKYIPTKVIWHIFVHIMREGSSIEFPLEYDDFNEPNLPICCTCAFPHCEHMVKMIGEDPLPTGDRCTYRIGSYSHGARECPHPAAPGELLCPYHRAGLNARNANVTMEAWTAQARACEMAGQAFRAQRSMTEEEQRRRHTLPQSADLICARLGYTTDLWAMSTNDCVLYHLQITADLGEWDKVVEQLHINVMLNCKTALCALKESATVNRQEKIRTMRSEATAISIGQPRMTATQITKRLVEDLRGKAVARLMEDMKKLHALMKGPMPQAKAAPRPTKTSAELSASSKVADARKQEFNCTIRRVAPAYGHRSAMTHRGVDVELRFGVQATREHIENLWAMKPVSKWRQRATECSERLIELENSGCEPAMRAEQRMLLQSTAEALVVQLWIAMVPRPRMMAHWQDIYGSCSGPLHSLDEHAVARLLTTSDGRLLADLRKDDLIRKDATAVVNKDMSDEDWQKAMLSHWVNESSARECSGLMKRGVRWKNVSVRPLPGFEHTNDETAFTSFIDFKNVRRGSNDLGRELHP